MTDKDYKQLDLLLAKLHEYLGRKFAIIPGYVQDGPYIGTFNEK